MSFAQRDSGLIVAKRPSIAVVRDRDPDEATMLCKLCQTWFWPGEERAFERHVKRCGNENADMIEEMSRRRRQGVAGRDQSPDPEREDWVREHAEDILHGRLKLGQGGV